MSPAAQIPDWFINSAVFLFGAVVGSFLNVCIYRMPRDESVVRPGSHCPICGTAIPWHHNIPIFTYVWLRGRTACCGAYFSARYWVIELVTACSFLLLWVVFTPQLAVAYIVFVCFLIVATATDLEHYIIPDEITYGGAAAGIIFSAMIPQLHGQTGHLASAGLSLAGFLTAFLILWGVVEAGKLAFGRKKVEFGKILEITANEESLSTSEEKLAWDEIMLRKTDQLVFDGEKISLKLGNETKTWPKAGVALTPEGITINGETFQYPEHWTLTASTSGMTIPREAMGFGDVKFIGCIGAFLGPASIFFVILISSLVGAGIGLLLMAIGKREWGGKLPYGPFLAFAAVLWIFFDFLAPETAAYYRDLITGLRDFFA